MLLEHTIMLDFMKDKSLPTPTGPYSISCVDLMTEFSDKGLFVRLHYPTVTPKSKKQSDSWIPWVPHDKYVQGLAYVVFLWVFVIRLAMWWYGGRMHIPASWEAKLLPQAERKNKKLPVIIFSHGFGACRFLCSSILTELASQGYLVASPEHRDTTACATYYYKSAEDRDADVRTWIPHRRIEFGAQHYALRNHQLKQRKNECVEILNLLHEINKGSPSENILNISLNLQQFESQLDLDQVTIMGHSFGGATALLALNSESRFKQGVILDGWMFPLKEEKLDIKQPLIFINSPTFHIASNISALEKVVRQPPDSVRQLYVIKNSTHETQTDTPAVLGYWLDWFKPKIDFHLGNSINNSLIIRFLQNYTGFPESVESYEELLTKHHQYVIADSLPHPTPVRRAFSLRLFF